MQMKVFMVFGGAIFAVAAGIFLYYSLRSPIKFKSLKLLDKSSLLHLLSLIRKEFSSKFMSVLRMNRKKRRLAHRGGRDYRMYVKDLKEQAKKHLQRAMDDVLLKNGISENVLSDSSKHFEGDEDVSKNMSKLCCIELQRSPSQLTIKKLEEVLEFYLSKAEEFNEEDPNELNLKMKMLEDEIYDEFSFEPEDIEAAVNKYENEVRNLVLAVRELNATLLERTNEELFF
ncbi:hypothetical protein SteCoe_34288 [Stentor coeruleus]|uniref:Uncharacterized protein n=1 Tax=Stentor coeruleus TaxID=5963 RepID=A0A1R2AV83_9CILI|nr:hypothetical protein SteCoe_34288 [Stentor coeruleus]